MIDRYGRDIHYLRISVTDLCNLRCQYCMPENGIDKKEHSDVLSIEEMTLLVKVFAELGINKVRITGGEPLVKKGLLTLIENIRQIEGISEIVLTTNGILLAEMAQALKTAGVDRVNISLDTLNPQKYEDITRGGDLAKVLEGIKKAEEVGLTPIKINTVLIGGFNEDEVKTFVNWTMEAPIDMRFIELMPLGEASNWSLNHFLNNQYILEQSGIKPNDQMEAEDPSSPATYYQLPGAKGKVGLISPISCKFCDKCNRLRLTSDGRLKMCLHDNGELDLISLLREIMGEIKVVPSELVLEQPSEHLSLQIQKLKEAIETAIYNKPLEHQLEKGEYLLKNMVQIGG